MKIGTKINTFNQLRQAAKAGNHVKYKRGKVAEIKYAEDLYNNNTMEENEGYLGFLTVCKPPVKKTSAPLRWSNATIHMINNKIIDAFYCKDVLGKPLGEKTSASEYV